MHPAQRKKVDMSTLTEEEKKLFSLYGKLPTHKNVLSKVQKDRKYFDSGDYALSKAGATNQVGTAIPSPETIPHPSVQLSPTNHNFLPLPSPSSPTRSSPIKDSFLNTAKHSK